MNRLSGKVALITGGNAGIGESIAKLFADEGAAVVITGRRQAELDRVVRAITVKGGKAVAVAGSVTDEGHAHAAVQQAIASFGKVDVLVNNAGVGDFGKRLHEMDDVGWAHVLDVNLTGVFRMTRAVIPQMLKQTGGAIVNVSSIASLVGIPLLSAYAASKGALDALTRENMNVFFNGLWRSTGKTVLLVTHSIQEAVFLSNRVVVLDHGVKIADGTPDEVKKNQAVIDAYLGVAH